MGLDQWTSASHKRNALISVSSGLPLGTFFFDFDPQISQIDAD